MTAGEVKRVDRVAEMMMGNAVCEPSLTPAVTMPARTPVNGLYAAVPVPFNSSVVVNDSGTAPICILPRKFLDGTVVGF